MATLYPENTQYNPSASTPITVQGLSNIRKAAQEALAKRAMKASYKIPYSTSFPMSTPEVKKEDVIIPTDKPVVPPPAQTTKVPLSQTDYQNAGFAKVTEGTESKLAPYWTQPTDTTTLTSRKEGGEYLRDVTQPEKIIRSVDDPSYEEKVLLRQGLDPRLYQVEHIIPKWAGGTNTEGNIQIMGVEEHLKKTKIQSVPQTLLAYGKIGATEALRMALGWDTRDDRNIPDPDDAGLIPIDVAEKKWKEWEFEPPQVGVMDVLKGMPKAIPEVSNWIKENLGIAGAVPYEFAKGVTSAVPIINVLMPELGKTGEYGGTAKQTTAGVSRFAGNVVGNLVLFGWAMKLGGTILSKIPGLSPLAKYFGVTPKAAATGAELVKAEMAGREVASSADLAKKFAEIYSGEYAKKMVPSFGKKLLTRGLPAAATMIGLDLVNTTAEQFLTENPEKAELGKKIITDLLYGGILGTAGHTAKGYGQVFAGTALVSIFEGMNSFDALANATTMTLLHGLGHPWKFKETDLYKVAMQDPEFNKKYKTSKFSSVTGMSFEPSEKDLAEAYTRVMGKGIFESALTSAENYRKGLLGKDYQQTTDPEILSNQLILMDDALKTKSVAEDWTPEQIKNETLKAVLSAKMVELKGMPEAERLVKINEILQAFVQHTKKTADKISTGSMVNLDVADPTILSQVLPKDNEMINLPLTKGDINITKAKIPPLKENQNLTDGAVIHLGGSGLEKGVSKTRDNLDLATRLVEDKLASGIVEWEQVPGTERKVKAVYIKALMTREPESNAAIYKAKDASMTNPDKVVAVNIPYKDRNTGEQKVLKVSGVSSPEVVERLVKDWEQAGLKGDYYEINPKNNRVSLFDYMKTNDIKVVPVILKYVPESSHITPQGKPTSIAQILITPDTWIRDNMELTRVIAEANKTVMPVDQVQNIQKTLAKPKKVKSVNKKPTMAQLETIFGKLEPLSKAESEAFKAEIASMSPKTKKVSVKPAVNVPVESPKIIETAKIDVPVKMPTVGTGNEIYISPDGQTKVSGISKEMVEFLKQMEGRKDEVAKYEKQFSVLPKKGTKQPAILTKTEEVVSPKKEEKVITKVEPKVEPKIESKVEQVNKKEVKAPETDLEISKVKPEVSSYDKFDSKTKVLTGPIKPTEEVRVKLMKEGKLKEAAELDKEVSSFFHHDNLEKLAKESAQTGIKDFGAEGKGYKLFEEKIDNKLKELTGKGLSEEDKFDLNRRYTNLVQAFIPEEILINMPKEGEGSIRIISGDEQPKGKLDIKLEDLSKKYNVSEKEKMKLYNISNSSEIFDTSSANIDKMLTRLASKGFIPFGKMSKGEDEIIIIRYRPELAAEYKKNNPNEKINDQDAFVKQMLKELKIEEMDANNLVARMQILANRYNRYMGDTPDLKIKTWVIKDKTLEEMAGKKAGMDFDVLKKDNPELAVKALENIKNAVYGSGHWYGGEKIIEKLNNDFKFERAERTAFKPAVDSEVVTDTGKTGHLIGKGLISKASKADLEMLKELGVDLGPWDLVTYQDNLKYGSKDIKDAKYFEMPLKDIALKDLSYGNPTSIKQSFFNKLTSNPEIKTDLLKMTDEKMKVYDELVGIFKEYKPAEERLKLLEDLKNKYDVVFDDYTYGEFKKLVPLGAGTRQFNYDIKKALKNFFIDNAYNLKIKNSMTLFIKPEVPLDMEGNGIKKWLNNQEIVLGRKDMKKRNIKEGEDVLVIRYPNYNRDEWLVLKAKEGDKRGATDLNGNSAMVSSTNVAAPLSGDFDADGFAIFKIGEGGLPKSFADAVRAEGGKTVPKLEITKREKLAPTVENIRRVIIGYQYGDDLTGKLAATARTMDMLDENKITINLTPAGFQKGTNYQILSGNKVVEEGNVGWGVKKASTITPVWGFKEKQLQKQLSNYALDSKKSDSIVKATGGDPNYLIKQIFKKKDGTAMNDGDAIALNMALKPFQNLFSIVKNKEDLDAVTIPGYKEEVKHTVDNYLKPSIKLFKEIKKVGGSLHPMQERVLTMENLPDIGIKESDTVALDKVASKKVEEVWQPFIKGLVNDKKINVKEVKEITDKAAENRKKYNEVWKDKKKTQKEKQEAREILRGEVIDMYGQKVRQGKLSDADLQYLAYWAAKNPNSNIAWAPRDESPKYVRRYREFMVDGGDISKTYFEAYETAPLETPKVEVKTEPIKEKPSLVSKGEYKPGIKYYFDKGKNEYYVQQNPATDTPWAKFANLGHRVHWVMTKDPKVEKEYQGDIIIDGKRMTKEESADFMKKYPNLSKNKNK